MKKHLKQLIQELHSGSLSGSELEEKEELLLGEFRQTEDPEELKALIAALAASGTILAVPPLFAVMKNNTGGIGPLALYAIQQIKDRARKRGSLLPEVYFTPGHWQPKWRGSKNGFLSYVSALAHIHAGDDDNHAEVNRIGEILADEFKVDIAPYHTFEEYRICAVDWDFQEDYRIILDRIEQESILAEVQEAGIEESWNTFLADNVMDLQYDYLVTRLRMAGKFEYHRFVMKIAECLNQKAG